MSDGLFKNTLVRCVVCPPLKGMPEERYVEDCLETWQKIVGGFIEIVPDFIQYCPENTRVFCNEEGRNKNLPVSYYFGNRDHFLLGPLVAVGIIEDRHRSLTRGEASFYLNFFQQNRDFRIFHGMA